MDAQRVNIRSVLGLSSPPVLSDTCSHRGRRFCTSTFFLRAHRHLKVSDIKGKEKQLYERTYDLINPDMILLSEE